MICPPRWWKEPPVRRGILLTLVILLGLWIRLMGLAWGQAWFYFGQGDGIEAYSVAVDYGQGTPAAKYLGQPNFNHHSKLPGPLWTVFCYTGLRLGGSIEGTVLLVILLNTAAIWLIYLLARATLGGETGLWAALFAATSPWAVYYSAGVYNPEVMCFLSALLFLALWRVSQAARSPAVFWVPFLLLAMPQFHMSGLMLIPAVILILVLCPARLNPWWLLAGMVAGLALYIPYVTGDMAHGWANTRGMIAGGEGYSWDGLKALSAPLSFLVNWAPRWTRSAAEYRELGRATFGFFWVFLVINLISVITAVFLVIGAFVQIRRAANGLFVSPRAAYARAPGIFFLTILFVGPLLAALVGGKPFHTRYCLVLLPAELSLCAAATARWFGASFNVRRVFQCCLVLTVVSNVWLMAAMYHAQGRQIESGPVLIPSFRKLEGIYSSLRAHAGPNASIQVKNIVATEHFAFPDYAVRDLELIQRFVDVRERERSGRLLRSQAVFYRVIPATEITAAAPGVAYWGNGIAVVATPPNS